VSLHYAAEAVTVLQWSRLSDYIGRKPILLMSLLGSVISTVLFGLSRSLWALILRYGFSPFLSYKMADH
jgi:MFS family permease